MQLPDTSGTQVSMTSKSFAFISFSLTMIIPHRLYFFLLCSVWKRIRMCLHEVQCISIFTRINLYYRQPTDTLWVLNQETRNNLYLSINLNHFLLIQLQCCCKWHQNHTKCLDIKTNRKREAVQFSGHYIILLVLNMSSFSFPTFSSAGRQRML